MNEDSAAMLEELKQIRLRLDLLVNQERRTEIATLVNALVGTRRKSLSLAELLNVARDVQYARYPLPNNADYQEWEQTKDERLSRIYK